MYVAAALTAAFDVLLQLYVNGFSLLVNEGLSYLLRYLLAVGWLSYLTVERGRIFESRETPREDEVSGNNPFTVNAWTHELPRPVAEAGKEDSIFFYGANGRGEKLAIYVSKLRNNVTEVWLCLYTTDGGVYTLPSTFTVDISDEAQFSGSGVHLECLAPNRRWRLAFNGLLKSAVKSAANSPATSESHVKFRFVWCAVSETLEHPVEVSCPLLAETLAQLPVGRMMSDIKLFLDLTSSYDQPGMMVGEIIIKGVKRKTLLTGSKFRMRGGVFKELGVEDHYFGVLEVSEVPEFLVEIKEATVCDDRRVMSLTFGYRRKSSMGRRSVIVTSRSAFRAF